MLHVRIGPSKMPRSSIFRYWRFMVVMLVVACLSTVLVQKYTDAFSYSVTTEKIQERVVLKLVSPCPTTICPGDSFSFFIQSGAGNVIPPKICFKNELILGASKNNAGVGINMAVVNGKTGEILKTGHYDMYGGGDQVVKSLIEFLQTIEKGSIVLLASYDDSATKLNEEARELIIDMGSSVVKTLKFRDNWIFVGGKGAATHTRFEKHLKSSSQNMYAGWPELIDISGCIPKYLH